MSHQAPIANWRNYTNKYRLCATKCVACNKIYYPKKHLCICGSQNFEVIELSGKGTLVTFTQVVNPPELFKAMAPYCVGIVELEEGPRVMAQLADTCIKKLAINMPVSVVFRKMYEDGQEGIINYGIKFILDEE